MIVADTDVLIDFLAGKDPGSTAVARELESGSLATTAINRFELLAGGKTPRQRHAIGALLGALPTLAVTEASADAAAALHRDLGARGEAIGLADCLIAGVVLRQDAALLTRNTRHFERVEGLRLVDLSRS
jgi:tRNA(fMet)-specific endonuclease VapC